MKDAQKLKQIYSQLPEPDQVSLMAFAEFLQARAQTLQPKKEIEKPDLLPPVPGESVVAALKRLSASYPMLNKAKLLADTSPLVSQHMMEGRDKKEVIADLEKVFQDHYQKLLEGN